MQIQIDDRPSYAIAKVALDPGEEIVAGGASHEVRRSDPHAI